MSRKNLGPPPDWIAADPAPEAAAAADPLRRIFDQARVVRSGDSEVDTVLQVRCREVADQLSAADVEACMRELLAEDLQNRGEFDRCILAPKFSSDVSDVPAVRLVVFLQPHIPGDSESPALRNAHGFLGYRGAGARRYANSLVFVAAEQQSLDEARHAARTALAWRNVARDSRKGSDAAQASQAATRAGAAHASALRAVRVAWRWVLAPTQAEPGSPLIWRDLEVDGDGPVAARAGARLQREGMLFADLDAAVLRRELERMRAAHGAEAGLAQAGDLFARSVWLPRLLSPHVVDAAVEGSDRTARRGAAMRRQPAGADTVHTAGDSQQRVKVVVDAEPSQLSRIAGAVQVGVARHLASIPGATVTARVTVEATVPGGISGTVMAVVRENADLIGGSSVEVE